MISNISTKSIEVLQAKQAAEVRYGKQPQSPADFAELSLRIKQTIGSDISPDTLSRLWGYKKGYPTVRRSVIDKLFAYGKANEESDFIYQFAIQADDMHLGEMLRIAWLPDREAVLEYLGNYRWRVSRVQNSKLQIDDTFSCRVFATHRPLVVDHLQTSATTYNGYVIGGKNGLTIVERF